MAKTKYYSLDEILKYKADYNMIYSERSNGKTFSVVYLILFGYHKNGININGFLDDGTQGAIIRRWEEDFKGKNGGPKMFDGIINNEELGNILKTKTKGKWNSIKYYSQKWFLQNIDEEANKVETMETPFCFGFALSKEEHYKSSSYNGIKNILFDEFITRNTYINDTEEFIYFTSVLSTIIRLRDNVHIFMCGNTINKYCPYFAEMGITNAKKQEKGTIDLYTYGESNLKVACERADSPAVKKKSNKYFAFNNPKLKMITTGDWELNIYPHLPVKYVPKDILYTFFIKFDNDIVQCEVINVKDDVFCFVHKKTTPIKEDDKTSIIYQKDYDHRLNYRRKITKPTTDIEKKIAMLFIRDKVFYQDNSIGDMVHNYILWCKNE